MVLPQPLPGSRAKALRGLGLLLRGAAWLLGLALVAAVVATGGLWWWAGQDGSLATALRLAARSQPLQAEGVRGALRGGGQVERLTWAQDGLGIEARGVDLSWQPLGLLLGEIQIQRLAVARLSIDDRRAPSSEPASAPDSLALPLRVSAPDIALGEIRYAGGATFEAQALAGRYAFDGLYHRIALDELRIAQGRYRAQGSIGAYASLPVDLRLSGALQTPVPGTTTVLPVSFDAHLRGPLATLDIDAALRTAADTAATAPQADLQARVRPFEPQPVERARASFRNLDLSTLWPGAPQTGLSGDAQLMPDSARAPGWLLATTLDNALPGPIDRGRLPLTRLEAQGEWRAGVGLVRSLQARLAGGELSAAGEWTDADTLQWRMNARVRGVDPGQIHAALSALPLDGRATAQGRGRAFDFDAALSAAAGSASASAPRAVQRVRGATGAVVNLRALRLREARAQGRWSDALLVLETLQVRTDDARLDAQLRVPLPLRGASGRLSLTAPGVKLEANGELRETAGAGQLALTADDTALALAWLRQWPGLRAPLGGIDAVGRGTLRARWNGGWRDPSLQADLAVPALDLRAPGDPAGPGAAPKTWTLRELAMSLNGRLADARLSLRGRLLDGPRTLSLQATAQGGQPGRAPAQPFAWNAAPWQASMSELIATVDDPALGGTWRLATRAPVALRFSAAGPAFEAGAGQAQLSAPAARRGATGSPPSAAAPTAPAVIAWQPVRWRAGEWSSAGRVTGLPMAWAEIFAGPQLAGLGLTGTLVFDGTWDAAFGQALKLEASLARSAGDITVRAEDATGGNTRVAAGVRDARLAVTSEGERVTATLRWDSERAGTADARLATRLARTATGGWQWSDDAPLEGRLTARLPRIGVWSVLAPPGWRLRGSLATDLAIAGTRAAPALTGDLRADDLALRSVVDGIEFGNGRLRSRLAGTRLIVDEFMLEGAGERGIGGTLSATGEAGWIDGRAQARLDAQVRQLRASIRTDRQITVSGQLAARMDGRAAELRGALTVDRALILLPEESKPTLGDDVIVVRGGTGAVGSQAPAAMSSPADPATSDARTLALAVKLDLGNDFRVQGRGIDTRVRGALDITGATLAAPRVTGSVRTFGGQYRAYGQRLDIEQGVLIFNGVPDNPALDILALRANMLSDQRVGVQITGTALLPRVRLYASPELSDAEKLSWLVLGRSSASGGAEAALLQQAALALLGSRGGGGMSGGLASALGLDELSVRGSGTNESGATTAGAITLGKRFSRNFYAAYERSLSGALGTLYVFYDLSRRFTVRAQTGEQSAVDLIYTLSYD